MGSMAKPLNFGQYQMMKRYTFNQMNQWALSVYASGYTDGQDSCQEYSAMNFEPETMYEFLIGIEGVSEDIATKIVQSMIEKGEQSTWTLER